MPERFYPISLAELDTWRRKHGVTSAETRKRFVQYVLLESIAAAPKLATQLSFKGGNALRFVYGNRRSTLDLDFSAEGSFPDNGDEIRNLIDHALATGCVRFGIKARCQSIRRNPPGANKTTPNYTIKVSYQFPGDPHFADLQKANVSTVVDVEISINDLVCEAKPYALAPQSVTRIRVCALEDIIAEKLRALLQQPIRKRNRQQDVYDIAHMLRVRSSELDRANIAKYLTAKARARGITARKSAFDDVVRQYAQVDYETLFSAVEPNFVPFDEAWNSVIALVSELDLPE